MVMEWSQSYNFIRIPKIRLIPLNGQLFTIWSDRQDTAPLKAHGMFGNILNEHYHSNVHNCTHSVLVNIQLSTGILYIIAL